MDQLIHGHVEEKGVSFVHAPALAGGVSARPGFTAVEFERFAEAGGFGGVHAELIRGHILKVNAQHLPHASVKMALYDAIKASITASGKTLRVIAEVSTRLGDDFVPIPDVVVWEPLQGAPAPKTFLPGDQVRLVVEVGDATIHDDTGAKLEEYAIAGIDEYWVADVQKRVIFQHAEPTGDTFGRRETWPFGSIFSALTLPLQINTSSLLEF